MFQRHCCVSRCSFTKDWDTVIGLYVNKPDLSHVLYDHLLEHAPSEKIVIVAGDFKDKGVVKCSQINVDI